MIIWECETRDDRALAARIASYLKQDEGDLGEAGPR